MRSPTSLPVTALLTALVALGPISTDLYLPSLPSLARYFAVGVDDIQLTLSVSLLPLRAVPAQPVLCSPSDPLGRPPCAAGRPRHLRWAGLRLHGTPVRPLPVAARLLAAGRSRLGPVLGRAIVRDVYGREGAAR